MLACRLAGHRFRFSADGPVMRWSCRRGCGAGGEKRYDSEMDAARYARAFNREDTADLGRRAPLLGLLPLRLWRWWRIRSRGRGRAVPESKLPQPANKVERGRPDTMSR